MVSHFGEVTCALLPLPCVAQMPANLMGGKKKKTKPTTFIKCVFTSSSKSPRTKHFSPAAPDAAQPAALPGMLRHSHGGWSL